MVAPRGDRPPGQGDRVAEAVLETVRELAAELHPGVSAPTVRVDSQLDGEIGLDSLAVAELLGRIERRLGVTLPDQLLASAETPRDLIEALVRVGDRLKRGDVPPRPARARGPLEVVAAPADAQTLVDVLEWHVDHHPDRPHLRILTDTDDVEEVTYAAVRLEAAEVAGGLRERGLPPGASVAIMLPTGREYFTAFLGTLLAGGIPVPVYPPGRPGQLEEHLRRHVAILDNAEATVLITIPQARPLARLVAPQLPRLREIITVSDLQAGASGGTMPGMAARSSDTALLQYTSGSTGDPKGVVLSHANLLANIRAMGQAGELTSADVFVSWLPLYHDMGLIGAWLSSMYVGIPLVVMSPLAFLARPARWLWALHEHGGTVSGGPNFGYELCLRRTEDTELEGLDLSRWRVAFNGAERVSPDTVTRFAERFAAHGLQPGAITPVYGLAESAVALAVPPLGRGARIDAVDRHALASEGSATPASRDDPAAVRFVSCGPPLPGHEIRIVDGTGAVLGERQEGRVLFTGPSATSGYHRSLGATSRLVEGGWLDSGDLGYVADGELYLTGRVKDLIIRGGRNLHPSELEEAVGSIRGVRRGCVAVFAAADDRTGTERLVVVAETRVTDPDDRGRIHADIMQTAVDIAGAPPDDILLAPPGAVPKTSSGKIRRAEAQERFERGELDVPGRAAWWQLARLARSSAGPALRGAGQAVARFLYGAYAMALFLVLGAIAWVLVAVLPGRGRRWRLVGRVGRILLLMAGVRLKVDGAERLPSDRAYVVAANHASHLDPLVLAIVLPQPVVFTAIAGLAGNPLVRIFLRRMGAHLVARGDRPRGVSDTAQLTEMVAAGTIVGFFPEGRRSPSPGLEPFRMGAFAVAANAGAPIVPIVLRGTRAILPVGGKLPRHTRLVTVAVEEAVATGDHGWSGAVELHRRTREAMLRHLDEPDLA